MADPTLPWTADDARLVADRPVADRPDEPPPDGPPELRATDRALLALGAVGAALIAVVGILWLIEVV